MKTLKARVLGILELQPYRMKGKSDGQSKDTIIKFWRMRCSYPGPETLYEFELREPLKSFASKKYTVGLRCRRCNRTLNALWLKGANNASGIVRSRKTTVGMARRAQMLVLAARGFSNRQIALELGANEHVVGRVRKQYGQRGLAVLEDRHSSGRPRSSSDEQSIQKVVEFNPDPKFGKKLLEVVALYMKPPDTPWCSAWTRRPASKHLTGHSRCYRCGLLSRVVGPTNMYAMGRARFWPAWILPPEKSSLMCIRGAKGLP